MTDHAKGSEGGKGRDISNKAREGKGRVGKEKKKKKGKRAFGKWSLTPKLKNKKK